MGVSQELFKGMLKLGVETMLATYKHVTAPSFIPLPARPPSCLSLIMRWSNTKKINFEMYARRDMSLITEDALVLALMPNLSSESDSCRSSLPSNF
jgi:hypothetical protein